MLYGRIKFFNRRVDVFVATPNGNYALEVQTTPQSYKKTKERQDKYIRDGIIGCWLFDSKWNSDSDKYRLEILNAIYEFIKTKKGKTIKLGGIKERYSNTINSSCKSFGCYSCDSIFEDWYIMEASLSDGIILSYSVNIKLHKNKIAEIEHWCYPGELSYCDENNN